MDVTASSQLQRATENDALIESSFRRLIASIESEREKIRSTWSQIEEEQVTTSDDLERLKLDTEEWCAAERAKIENDWKRLDRLREKMSVLFNPDSKEVLQINCSGVLFNLPKHLLVGIEGSYLNHMFSAAYIVNVPRDEQGRYFLDFNPECFGIIVDWLIETEVNPEAPVPPVPQEQQQNMDMLAQALNLRPFLRLNTVITEHRTSLKVSGNVIQATHSGWQLISAANPLRLSGPTAYFEIKVLHNPDPKTDRLALGVCGHQPQGPEAHTIRIKDAVLFNSNVGLIGDAINVSTCSEKTQLATGSTFGIKYDLKMRTLHFWHNKLSIGSCTLKQESLERMQVLYPIFALHAPEQKIEVDFSLSGPMGSRKTDSIGEGDTVLMGGADSSRGASGY